MASHDKPRSSKGRPTTQPSGQDEQADKSQTSEPGTEGPQGTIDDQPQREDEYLSRVLNEFNPQRKDKNAPLPGAKSGKETPPDRKKDEL